MDKALTHQDVISIFELTDITPGEMRSPKYNQVFSLEVPSGRFSVEVFPKLEQGEVVLAMIDQVGLERERDFKYYECRTLEDMQMIITRYQLGHLQSYKFFVGKSKT